MMAGRELSIKDKMSVQNTANRIGNGLVHIVPLNQYGIDRGDRPLASQACALYQTWQQAVNRGRQPASAQGFASGQTDFPLSAGKARRPTRPAARVFCSGAVQPI